MLRVPQPQHPAALGWEHSPGSPRCLSSLVTKQGAGGWLGGDL